VEPHWDSLTAPFTLRQLLTQNFEHAFRLLYLRDLIRYMEITIAKVSFCDLLGVISRTTHMLMRSKKSRRLKGLLEMKSEGIQWESWMLTMFVWPVVGCRGPERL
jgi:hypothetical protein